MGLLPATPTLGPFVGRPTRLPDGRRSAIVKAPSVIPLWLSTNGLGGDQVADTRLHGGPEMAVHQYPAEHFEQWRRQFPEIASALLPGSIGENFSTTGLTENNVHIGDVFRWGDAIIEVNQPRMPCGKIESRYGAEGLVAAIMAAGQCGWYFRVRQEGEVPPGATLTHVERPTESVSLAELWTVQNTHRPDHAALQRVINAPGLAAKWQKRFAQRLRWLESNDAGGAL